MSRELRGPEKLCHQERTVGCLPSASKTPQSVMPGNPIEKAITIMLLNDFSQLPVMENGHAKGIIRWPSVIKGLFDSKQKGTASDWATEARTMHRDRSIYDAFEEVLSYEYVLVTADHMKVCGIVTPYDLGVYAHEKLVPFMLVEEIELSLRGLIEKFKLDSGKRKDLAHHAKSGNGEKAPSLGELIKILNHDDNWQKLQTQMSQPDVLEIAAQVQRYRNSIMHFNSHQGTLDMKSLKVVARFLGQIGLDGPKEKRRNPE